MKGITWQLAVGLAMAVGSVPVLGDASASKPVVSLPKGVSQTEAAELDTLNKAVTLTDAQKAQIVQKLDDLHSALTMWQQQNGANLQRLRQQAKQAQASGDKEAAKTVNQAMQPLQAQVGQIRKNAEAAIMAILTPEQQAAWNIHEFYTPVIKAFAKLDLTDDQVKKIQAMAADAVKELAPDVDAKARSHAMVKFRKQVIADVLTDSQREALAAQQPAGKGKGMATPSTQPAKGTANN